MLECTTPVPRPPCFSAGEWVGSSGLWEDRGPANYDRTGPSVPEPLPVIWLYLKGPCALKPSPHCEGSTTTPVQQLKPPPNPVRDNPVKTNDFIFLFHAEMHCQARPRKKKTKRHGCWYCFQHISWWLPKYLLFIHLASTLIWNHTTWLHDQFCTDMKNG